MTIIVPSGEKRNNENKSSIKHPKDNLNFKDSLHRTISYAIQGFLVGSIIGLCSTTRPRVTELVRDAGKLHFIFP